MVLWDPLGYLGSLSRMQIVDVLKTQWLDPLGSGDHSHTSFSTGGFWTAQRTLGSYVIYFDAFVAVLANDMKNLQELLNEFILGQFWAQSSAPVWVSSALQLTTGSE